MSPDDATTEFSAIGSKLDCFLGFNTGDFSDTTGLLFSPTPAADTLTIATDERTSRCKTDANCLCLACGNTKLHNLHRLYLQADPVQEASDTPV